MQKTNDIEQNSKPLNIKKLCNLIDGGLPSSKECEQIGKAVIVIGATASGKSTLINSLIGNNLLARYNKVKGTFIELAPGQKGPIIGNTICSETTSIKFWKNKKGDITFIDCPGFGDNRGSEQDIANAVFIKEVFAAIKQVKVLFVAPQGQFDLKNAKCESLMKFIDQLSDLFADIDVLKNSSALVVTKVQDECIVKKGKAILTPVTPETIRNILLQIKEDHSKNQESDYFNEKDSLPRFTKVFDSLLDPNKILISKCPEVSDDEAPDDEAPDDIESSFLKIENLPSKNSHLEQSWPAYANCVATVELSKMLDSNFEPLGTSSFMASQITPTPDYIPFPQDIFDAIQKLDYVQLDGVRNVVSEKSQQSISKLYGELAEYSRTQIKLFGDSITDFLKTNQTDAIKNALAIRFLLEEINSSKLELSDAQGFFESSKLSNQQGYETYKYITSIKKLCNIIGFKIETMLEQESDLNQNPFEIILKTICFISSIQKPQSSLTSYSHDGMSAITDLAQKHILSLQNSVDNNFIDLLSQINKEVEEYLKAMGSGIEEQKELNKLITNLINILHRKEGLGSGTEEQKELNKLINNLNILHRKEGCEEYFNVNNIEECFNALITILNSYIKSDKLLKLTDKVETLTKQLTALYAENATKIINFGSMFEEHLSKCNEKIKSKLNTVNELINEDVKRKLDLQKQETEMKAQAVEKEKEETEKEKQKMEKEKEETEKEKQKIEKEKKETELEKERLEAISQKTELDQQMLEDAQQKFEMKQKESEAVNKKAALEQQKLDAINKKAEAEKERLKEFDFEKKFIEMQKKLIAETEKKEAAEKEKKLLQKTNDAHHNAKCISKYLEGIYNKCQGKDKDSKNYSTCYKITGINVELSAVFKRIECEGGVLTSANYSNKVFVVYATKQIKIDSDITYKSGQVILVAPEIVCYKKTVIDLSGSNGTDGTSGSSGSWHGGSSGNYHLSKGGDNGEDGKNGLAGGPGGSIIMIAQAFNGLKDNLTLNISGGDGGNGGYGGYGGSCYGKKYILAPDARSGGNGGNGGSAGRGGLKGKVEIYESKILSENAYEKLIESVGKDGSVGPGGSGGEGWKSTGFYESGYDGSRGKDGEFVPNSVNKQVFPLSDKDVASDYRVSLLSMKEVPGLKNFNNELLLLQSNESREARLDENYSDIVGKNTTFDDFLP